MNTLSLLLVTILSVTALKMSIINLFRNDKHLQDRVIRLENLVKTMATAFSKRLPIDDDSKSILEDIPKKLIEIKDDSTTTKNGLYQLGAQFGSQLS
jgi:hypothetical protein